MPSADSGGVCADCHNKVSRLLDIRRRFLCSACFSKYVFLKIAKRIESYGLWNQVGDAHHKFLLPLSGGVSSLVLLQVLDAKLKRQFEQRKRYAYDLVLVHVKTTEQDESVKRWEQSVQNMFGQHEFLPVLDLVDVLRFDVNLEEDLRVLGLARTDAESDAALIGRLFVSMRTASGKADLHDILTQRLITAVAKRHACEGVFWGHSDSRLAAKVLADVAKGRGGSAPNSIADGTSPQDVNLYYPLRDLYKTELDLYMQNQTQDMLKCILDSPSNANAYTPVRNTSIDALLTGYIGSQGAKYPSIMANVVRTAGKLQELPVAKISRCKLCSAATTNAINNSLCLCYGCIRLKQDIKF